MKILNDVSKTILVKVNYGIFAETKTILSFLILFKQTQAKRAIRYYIKTITNYEKEVLQYRFTLMKCSK